MDVKKIRLHLLAHECLSMVGLPKKHEVQGKMSLKDELKAIFSKEKCTDPFVFTRYEVNSNSKEFQDLILSEEVLELSGKNFDY